MEEIAPTKKQKLKNKKDLDDFQATSPIDQQEEIEIIIEQEKEDFIEKEEVIIGGKYQTAFHIS